jgi:hypothetical protein
MKATTYVNAIAAVLIGLASASAHAFTTPTNLLGAVSTPDQARRTIQVDNKTSFVNVRYGETVNFVDASNGQNFAVKFDGTRDSFHLNRLAPTGALDHPVMVYVSPSWLDERVM